MGDVLSGPLTPVLVFVVLFANGALLGEGCGFLNPSCDDQLPGFINAICGFVLVVWTGFVLSRGLAWLSRR